jgi:3-methyladenine DNA glycosylase AlkD
MVIDVKAERQHLLGQIEQYVDPEYQAGMSKAVPTGLKMYGVKVPRLREISRDWQRAHKKIAREDLVALVETLWDGESREERVLALELLQRYKRWLPDLAWAHFERWRRGLDNWEVTDVLGVRILGPWVLEDPDGRLDHLWALIADEDVWSRRLAVVATVWLNRGRKDASFPAFTLELIDRVKEERHPMITKAVSWALREMIKKHPDRVAAYLEENREVLAAHVVREVDNKLRTGLKSGKTGG